MSKESPTTIHSKVMAKVKDFTDRQTYQKLYALESMIGGGGGHKNL